VLRPNATHLAERKNDHGRIVIHGQEPRRHDYRVCGKPTRLVRLTAHSTSDFSHLVAVTECEENAGRGSSLTSPRSK